MTTDDGATSVIVADHHGTGHLAIDMATGELTQRRTLPFGGLRGTDPGLDWPGTRSFVGGIDDTEATGLINLGAREYDPAIGRFISPDPIMDLTDSEQIHGYTYANNNPLAFSDLSGLFLNKAVAATIGATKAALSLARWALFPGTRVNQHQPIVRLTPQFNSGQRFVNSFGNRASGLVSSAVDTYSGLYGGTASCVTGSGRCGETFNRLLELQPGSPQMMMATTLGVIDSVASVLRMFRRVATQRSREKQLLMSSPPWLSVGQARPGLDSALPVATASCPARTSSWLTAPRKPSRMWSSATSSSPPTRKRGKFPPGR
ncbi:RHS repeat-associated core domain-containing protein [Streptomyces calidiresistens]|uniref:Teneurin-like YD-shell domain-containing protein n=1 Tax=Streptomyces calidiresistens TaxID=1485586 RepID=A0A7W3T0N9_9ACTN|nr:RHS repeat-associated core domain-containing protein [Streptomyces calidiresistens]MBB0228703.1 hypothetical protein [Streptomyces calidiresistens]